MCQQLQPYSSGSLPNASPALPLSSLPCPTQEAIKGLIKDTWPAACNTWRTATTFIHRLLTLQEQWTGSCWRVGLPLRQLPKLRPNTPKRSPAGSRAHWKNWLKHLCLKTIIYRMEKVILQYWSYSAASKMTEYDIRLENLSWNH